MDSPPTKKQKTTEASVGAAADDDEVTRAIESYWLDRLQSLPETRLPTDFQRHSLLTQSFVEAEVSHDFNDATCLALLKFSLKADHKPFTVVLGAFSALVHKYTHDDDLVIGSSSSSFNPLALRLNLSAAGDDGVERTLRDLVDHVREVDDESVEHEVPFDSIISALVAKKATQLGSLFQLRVFNACDVSSTTLSAASCDWTLFLEQRNDAKRLLPLSARVLYNSALYKRTRLEEMLRQLELVVLALCESPDAPFSRISTVTDAARRHALPDPCAELDATWHGAIHEHLTRWARAHPDRALIFDDGGGSDQPTRVITYAHVERQANRLANHLISSGIVVGDVVALYAHRSAALVVGIMAILKAGATMTVIDPQYPVERQTIYLEVAQPSALVVLEAAGELMEEVDQYVREKLPNLKCRVQALSVDGAPALSDASDTPPTGVHVGPETIGTLSFTSGSTGRPKGVCGRHLSLTHFYPWMADEFALSNTDRFSMLSGIAHDPIQRDVFTPIFFGASICIPSFETIHTPGRLAEWMAAARVTVTHLTPAMGQLLCANASEQMPTLRVAFFVGDVLCKRDVQRLQSLAANASVVNMLGTTETQRAVSNYTVSPTDAAQFSSLKEVLPAGKGMKDVQLLILAKTAGDEESSSSTERRMPRLAGVGELGEIYVRSPAMARGYLKLPEETALKFLPNPFGDGRNELDRVYRTGDLGRYNADGVVECVGRADDQVKIRGFRIELGEIDTHLSHHESIRECVTLVRRDAHEEKVLVSYFVPVRANETVDQSELREWLRSKLPHYSVPSIFFQLTRFPLTPNGKIDRRKLPAPVAQLQQLSVNEQAFTVLQKRLATLWEEVLGRKCSLDDSFFDIGGHSINATQLTFKMRNALRVELPLNLLYAHASLRKLSEAVQKLLDEGDDGGALEQGGTMTRKKSTTASSSRENSTGNAAAASSGSASSVDLRAEVKLDESIRPRSLAHVYTPLAKEEVRNVFLTGASGFVGAFLLARLLEERPRATIWCLMRSSTGDIDEAYSRLKRQLMLNGVWNDDASVASRIKVVLGDLSQPLLGISQQQWTTLSQLVDEIYHNGALVHWVYDYHRLRAANVGAVSEVLRMCVARADQRLTPLFFVSSTSVFDSDHYATLTSAVHEDDELSAHTGLGVGYAQSKWVAEGVCRVAMARGVPVAIFRPAYILGSSKTGVSNTDDFILRLISGCIQMKASPAMRNKITATPVDFVAAAIVHCASLPSSIGHAFHFLNPDDLRFSTLFECIRSFGYDVQEQEYIAWRDALMTLTLASNDNALFPLLHFVLDDLPNKSKNPELLDDNMSNALNDSGIECPSLLQHCMPRFLAFLIRSGYLPPPPLAGAGYNALPMELELPESVFEDKITRQNK